MNRLFPGQLSYHLGNSLVTLPNYLKEQKERGVERPCDLFSVDGDHSYAGAKADLLNAINGTRVGGMLFMDDMGAEGGPRRAFDEMCKAGFVRKTWCTENVWFNISHVDRRDSTELRHQQMSWCFGTILPRA